MPYTRFPLLALLLLTVLSACGQPAPTTTETTPPPSRRELTRNAMRASVWRFVYCLEDDQDPTKLVAFLEEVAAAQPFDKRIEVVNCRDVPEEELRTQSYTAFGSLMPVSTPTYGDNGYNLIPNHRRAADDVVFLPYYDNPWDDGQALTAFYLADDANQLTDVLRRELDGNFDRLFWPNWAYEIHRANGDRVYGSFKGSGWAFDAAEEVALKSPDVPVYDADGLKIFAYDGAIPNANTDLVANTLRRINFMLTSNDISATTVYPEVRLYPTLERIGLRRDDMAPVQYDRQKHVLHVVPSFVSEDELLLHFSTWHLFVARTQVLSEDLKATIAGHQHRLSAEIGNERYGRRITEAMRVNATGILGRPDQERPSLLLQEARARMKAIESAGRVAPPTRKPFPTTPLAGMTFAHEGYRVHNGYGGEKIKPSLDSLATLNVNALAIVPYTFMRDPGQPTSLHIPDRAGSENDYATACSAREASDRGWFTLLKPQIWIGGGSWPGDVDFATDEEWNTFFENYTYWILHYAVLAEREGIDALCIGTELVKTTVKHPARWREMIRKIRTIYGGQLTYAANWGEEFEQFAFWDDLDAIGLNSYYPIASGETATDEELLNGARRWLQMAAEHSRDEGRPLWLTEVGYRSVAAAWQHPHAEAGERAFSAEDQARCYRALWTAAAETPELTGAFVWKWPSYIGYDGGRRSPNRGFTPGGKAAAKELEQFYERWRKR